jgi:LPXTG-motif cell wall-anchored protein
MLGWGRPTAVAVAAVVAVRGCHVTGYTSYDEAKRYAQEQRSTHNTVMTVIGVLLLLAAIYFIWRRIKANRF